MLPLLLLFLVNFPLIILNYFIDLFYFILVMNVIMLVIYGVPGLKFILLSKPLYICFKNFIPSISKTEEEALYAGDVWIASEAITGKPDWDKITNSGSPKLSSDEQNYLDTVVSELCSMSSDWELYINGESVV